jgi:sugar transferase (PEP-CTERM/EpsH1 system associated)
VDVLLLAPYAPYPPRFGGAVRVFHLIRVLAREHRVTLLCFASAEERAALGPLHDICAAIHTVEPPPGQHWKRLYQLRSLLGRPYSYYVHYSPAMAATLERVLARQRFDLVQLEFGDVAPYYTPSGPVPWVLDEHNVEYRLLERSWQQASSPLRRLYNRLEARKLKRDELAACRRADAVLTTSDVDRATLAPDVPGVPIRVVPNGVDTSFFTPGDPAEIDPACVLFTGAIDYHPNTDGVRYFHAEILPRIQAAAPEAVFTVVGKDPPAHIQALAGPRVVVTGSVPDVRPWMRRGAVAVVPLRVGGGTRLKILEALATGRAVVSTSLGCEGIEITPGEDILIADTPADFADAVLRCLRDPGLRARLGRRGRALVERRYRWEAIGDGLSGFYRKLVTRHRPACVA